MSAATILIVEDDAAIRKALKDKLEFEKFGVLEAINGAVGLDLALKKHPDMILLDLVMPTMDGFTALKALRADSWGKNAQVIALTNVNDNDKVAAMIESGVYEYIVKTDWKIENVVAKVKEKLSVPAA